MDELEAIRMRDEVLQAMYWMHAEGLAAEPTVAELARFLAVPLATLPAYVDRFVEDGLLERSGDGVRLSASGQDLGRRMFAEEFADMTKPSHGECDEDCWCHDSPDEAARCLHDRAGHVHQH